jgi:catalase
MEKTEWKEVYDGGSPEAEEEIFRALAVRMVKVQERNRIKSRAPVNRRTLHAKIVVGVTNARFEVARNLDASYRVGPFQPGATIRTMVRLSNASGIAGRDGGKDMRGAALRLELGHGRAHDLLMTSYPVSHARNARQFVQFAEVMAGNKLLAILRLFIRFGPIESRRMLRNVLAAATVSRSLALERFWSRGAILWGHAGPVRFLLRPEDESVNVLQAFPEDPDCLAQDFAARLKRGPVRFAFSLQPFRNERLTPIEDGTVKWTEEVSRPVQVATLVIPEQDLEAPDALAVKAEVDSGAFSPWNAPDEFRPLGNLNRARKSVYAASAAHWLKSGK